MALEIADLGDVGGDKGRRAELAQLMTVFKHALRWEDARRIAACLELARSDIPALPNDFDLDPWLFNVLNGTLNLRLSGELRPRTGAPRAMISKLAPVNYDPSRGLPALVTVPPAASWPATRTLSPTCSAWPVTA